MSSFAVRTPLFARSWSQSIFLGCALFCVCATVFALLALLINILIDAWPRLTFDFIKGYPSRFADKAGILPALVGSVSLIGLVAIFSLPVGIGAAIYLEEYAPRNKFTKFIELNIANLAGVPSIIYGLLGLHLFVRILNLDRSLVSGALTLSLLILPIIIISTREALRTVPRSIRQGAMALGANKWQTVWFQVLPVAAPGILTGCILAFSRAIGETAPLVTLGALTYVAFLPTSIFSAFTALPIQAFNWLSRPQAAFHANAAAAIVVLLAILLCLNAIAIVLRNKYQKRLNF